MEGFHGADMRFAFGDCKGCTFTKGSVFYCFIFTVIEVGFSMFGVKTRMVQLFQAVER